MMNNNNYMYPSQMQPRVQNGINWVQGIEGAKAFQMMPSSNTVLLDSENENIFYIKISDNIGMCNLRVFKYEEISDFSKPHTDMSQYITRDELESILNAKLGGHTNGKSTIQPTKSDKSNTSDKLV